MLSAVEEMDSGDVWATRTFALPAEPARKSALYSGVVADTAVELVRQTVERFADPGFRPWRQDRERRGLAGRTRPMMRQADRAFDWSCSPEHILRAVRAADGSPGVRTTLCGLDVRAYDAHPGVVPSGGAPGSVAARRNGAVLVRTGDGGGVWIGHLKADGGIKLPAAAVLGEQRLRGVPADTATESYPEIAYRRSGAVGTLTVDLYNGAMSAGQAVRVANAIRHATAQDTRVLVLRGGDAFCNGINLNVIEASADPRGESWRSILAIDEVCRLLLTTTSQLVVAAVAGDAGAGGAMLALTGDRVLVRSGAVLNPHYRTMGLHGSEYWTYTLPRRVGAGTAARLTTECLPIGSPEALSLGFADAELAADRAAFDLEVAAYAEELAGRDDWSRLLEAKREQLEQDARRRPLDAHLAQELGEMARDFFDDEHGYAAARTAFVGKQRPAATPLRLARHRVDLPLARTGVVARPDFTARAVAG